jgi:hypothetical protein
MEMLCLQTLMCSAARMMEIVWPNCNAWAQSICGADWQACGEQLLTPDAMMVFEEIAGRNEGVEGWNMKCGASTTGMGGCRRCHLPSRD